MSRFARMYGMEYVGMATSSTEAKTLSEGNLRGKRNEEPIFF